MTRANAGRAQVGAVAVAAIMWMGTTAATTAEWVARVVAVGIPFLALLAAFHAVFHEHATGPIARAVVGAVVAVALGSLAALSIGATGVATAANLALVGGLVALALAIRRGM